MDTNTNTKFVIERAINGITINGREFVLRDDGEVMTFENKQLALDFLKSNGIDNLENEGIDILLSSPGYR